MNEDVTAEVTGEEVEEEAEDEEASRPPYRVRLPGFIRDEEEIGLGDVIKRVTSAAGIRPCGGCRRRAAALNRRFIFTGRARSPGSRNP